MLIVDIQIEEPENRFSDCEKTAQALAKFCGEQEIQQRNAYANKDRRRGYV